RRRRRWVLGVGQAAEATAAWANCAPTQYLVPHPWIHLHLLAAIRALRVVHALLRAIRVAPPVLRAARIPLALHRILLRRVLRGRARDQRDAHAHRQRAPQRPRPHGALPDDGGGFVTAGRFLRHSSKRASNPLALGGSLGRPITGAPSRDQSNPTSLTLSHTNSARPRMFSN